MINYELEFNFLNAKYTFQDLWEVLAYNEEDEGEDEKLVSTKEAVQCFKNCLSWMESQNDIAPVQLMQLRRMMDFAMRSRYKSLKQTNMLEHLRPL